MGYLSGEIGLNVFTKPYEANGIALSVLSAVLHSIYRKGAAGILSRIVNQL